VHVVSKATGRILADLTPELYALFAKIFIKFELVVFTCWKVTWTLIDTIPDVAPAPVLP
jgi:hypothetical protein